MGVELTLAIGILLVIVLVSVHAWWTMPQTEYVPEMADIGHVAVAPPPPKPRDVLDDYAALLDLDMLTATAATEHRLAVLEGLLEEADHETVRLELLVNKLGRELLPVASGG